MHEDFINLDGLIEFLLALAAVLAFGVVACGVLGGLVGGWLLRRGKASSALWTGFRIGCLVFGAGVVFYYVTLTEPVAWNPEEKLLFGSYFVFPALAFLLAAAYTFVTRRPKAANP